jgi:hypothetical protein
LLSTVPVITKKSEVEEGTGSALKEVGVITSPSWESEMKSEILIWSLTMRRKKSWQVAMPGEDFKGWGEQLH